MPKIRTIRIEGDIAYVPLTKGYEAIVDAADVSLVEGHNWHVSVREHTVYAIRTSSPMEGLPKTVRMHRQILGFPAGLDVDHISGDGLDNRRSNLRPANDAENTRNQRRRATNTSGYKGVHFEKSRRRWRATIRVDGRKTSLGYFDTPAAAHAAYVEAANQHHKAFGRAR